MGDLRICWICGKAVTLEDCAVDEYGLAVHEECYVARVALERHRAPEAAQAPTHPCTGFGLALVDKD
jgi:hypothetical protein